MLHFTIVYSSAFVQITLEELTKKKSIEEKEIRPNIVSRENSNLFSFVCFLINGDFTELG